jgi:hypothetical protein
MKPVLAYFYQVREVANADIARIRAGLLRLEGELAEKIKWRDAVQAEINRRQRDIDRHKPKSTIVIRRKQRTMTT